MKKLPDMDDRFHSRCHRFFKRFRIGTLLRECNIEKNMGFSCLVLLFYIFTLIFSHKNLHTILKNSINDPNIPKKDVFYRFLNEGSFNWRRLLLRLSKRIADVINPLTSPDRERVFIFDDTIFGRNRSKLVELLANIRDHSKNCYVRGFRMLTLGWSDGNTFLPLGFSLLSSRIRENRYQEMRSNLDKRTLAYRRRLEAITNTNDVVISLLEQALAEGHRAKYVLFDSWFAFPKTIGRICHLGLDVVCRLKKLPKVYYTYNGKLYNLEKLYSVIRKRRGKANIKASVIVTITNVMTGQPMEVKIVFVRNKKKKGEWIAFLSTDISLSDEEILRIYSKRWEIEVFFKMEKSYLQLAKEFQGRSYDMMTAHTTIVCIRYLMIALESREQQDDRSFGGMFYECCDEMQDISFNEALLLILDLLKQSLKKVEMLSEGLIGEILDYFIESLPAWLKSSIGFSGCES